MKRGKRQKIAKATSESVPKARRGYIAEVRSLRAAGVKAHEALAALTEASGGMLAPFYFGADHGKRCDCGASKARHAYGRLAAAVDALP